MILYMIRSKVYITKNYRLNKLIIFHIQILSFFNLYTSILKWRIKR